MPRKNLIEITFIITINAVKSVLWNFTIQMENGDIIISTQPLFYEK